MDDLPELRATVPALEPDPVLLGQLVELSAASAAADTAARTRPRPAGALITGAAALGLVAATSWIAGALPGVPSPIAPEQAPPPAPTAPAKPHHTGDVRVPSVGARPTSGVSSPHAETPGVVPSDRGRSTGRSERPWASPTDRGGRGDRGAGQGERDHARPERHVDEDHQRGPNAESRGGRHGQHPATSPPERGRHTGRPMSDPTTGP